MPGPRALHYREGLGMRWVVRRALDPTRHRRRWRSTNLLERSLGEVKRCTKVIGRFPGETSCRTLVWAVLDLYISHATNGVRFTQLERQRLRQIRYQGNEQTNSEEVSAA
jgi:putative transposase